MTRRISTIFALAISSIVMMMVFSACKANGVLRTLNGFEVTFKNGDGVKHNTTFISFDETRETYFLSDYKMYKIKDFSQYEYNKLIAKFNGYISPSDNVNGSTVIGENGLFYSLNFNQEERDLYFKLTKPSDYYTVKDTRGKKFYVPFLKKVNFVTEDGKTDHSFKDFLKVINTDMTDVFSYLEQFHKGDSTSLEFKFLGHKFSCETRACEYSGIKYISVA